jgi:hypothetical protein
LAASLKARFGEDPEIATGKTGQFDVLADGELVFSKAETGRFPLENEVEERVAAIRRGETPRPVASKPAKGSILRRLAAKLRA